ncbi:hypothetical protein [Polaromonas sp.]|uniref:hypothetical protein n=1 Tax=Polaromonas sp. TaxID=1869339 RepID=UPI0025FC43EF|nr:hypothetical protein [Polaromonas sp.]
MRRHIEELQAELQATRTTGPAGTSDLAQGEDPFEVHFSFIASPDKYSHNGSGYSSTTTLNWEDIFSTLSPLMIHEATESDLVKALNSLVGDSSYENLKKSKGFRELNLLQFKINSEDFQTIKIQLRALGLITRSTKSRSVKDTATYWTLTPYGDNVMTKLRAIKKPQAIGAKKES